MGRFTMLIEKIYLIFIIGNTQRVNP